MQDGPYRIIITDMKWMMQKNLSFSENQPLVFPLFLMMMALPPPNLGAEESFYPPPAGREPFGSLSEAEYALLSLTAWEGSTLEREIARLEEREELKEQGIERDRALGMVHIARYLRREKKQDALKALELLEPLPADTHLRKAYLGVAHAFAARIRTIFGVGNLEAMQEILEEIPEHLDDPLVRFLRGNTLVQVGRALPGMFTLGEIKERAIAVGTADLRYILGLEAGRVDPSFVQQAKRVLEEE